MTMLKKESNIPLYIQIRDILQEKILSGEFPTGYKLPGERQLAAELGVSRNTIIHTYNALIDQGLAVVSQKPKGYFVGHTEPNVPKRIFQPLSKLIKNQYKTNKNIFEEQYYSFYSRKLIDMGRISIKNEKQDCGSITFKELYSCGEEETLKLKQHICDMLKKQSIYVNENNIQLLSETSQILEYIISIYLDKGDYVFIEEPASTDTINVFRNKEINLITVPMTEEGMDLEELRRLIRIYAPKLIYTMPNLHNPTGITMPLNRRYELLQISKEEEIPIVEDNSLKDLRYDGRELTPLFAIDSNKMVLYMDTFTLTSVPGIKVAYVVGPREPVEVIGNILFTSECRMYNVSHTLINRTIEEGHYQNHIDEIKRECRASRDYLCKKMEPLKEKGIKFNIPEGGPCLWCELPGDVNENTLFALCLQKGLIYMPGNAFYPYGYMGNAHIRLCFSNVTKKEIEKAVHILAEALEESRI